jgi:hypothetical protein
MARMFSRTLQQTYQYNASQRIVIDIPRVAFIKKIKVLLSGSISNSGTTAATLPSEPFPYNLVQNISITYNGSKNLYNVSGQGWGIYKYQKTQGQNPAIPAPSLSVSASGSVPVSVQYDFDMLDFPAPLVHTVTVTLQTPANLLPSGVSISANFIVTVEYVDYTPEEIIAKFGRVKGNGLPEATVMPYVIEFAKPVAQSAVPVRVDSLPTGADLVEQLVYAINSSSGIENNDPTYYELELTRGTITEIISKSWQALQAEMQAQYKVAPYAPSVALIDYTDYDQYGFDLTYAPSDSMAWKVAIQNSDTVYSLFVGVAYNQGE